MRIDAFVLALAVDHEPEGADGGESDGAVTFVSRR